MTRADEIDDIRNTLLESFDQTNDMHGPNWEHMAEKVYAAHVAPLLDGRCNAEMVHGLHCLEPRGHGGPHGI